jgi:drug/metabolite transporter (DMT)-like permease
MWIFLALLCSLFNALQGAHGKRILERIDPYLVTWAMFFHALPLLLVALWVDGFPRIQPSFWPALAISLGVNLLAVTLYVRAIKLSPLSLTFPFLALTPLFLVLTGYVALGELPDTLGAVGILLIVAGAYVLNLDKLREGLLGPVRSVVRERGSLLMIVVAALWGISAAADKVALLSSSPFFFLVVFHLLFSVLYLPVLRVKARGCGRQALREIPALLVFGSLGAIMILFQMAAVRIALVSYVIAIKRAGMIFSILLGYFFFGERHLKVRMAGAALMVAGVCCIVL